MASASFRASASALPRASAASEASRAACASRRAFSLRVPRALRLRLEPRRLGLVLSRRLRRRRGLRLRRGFETLADSAAAFSASAALASAPSSAPLAASRSRLRPLRRLHGGVRGRRGANRHLTFFPELRDGRREPVLGFRGCGSPALSLALGRLRGSLRPGAFLLRASVRALGERSRGGRVGSGGVAFALGGDATGLGFGERSPGVRLGGVRGGDSRDGVRLERAPGVVRLGAVVHESVSGGFRGVRAFVRRGNVASRGPELRLTFLSFASRIPQRRFLLLDGGAQRGNLGSRGVERHLDGGAFPALATERHLRVRRASERRGELGLDFSTRASSVLLGGGGLRGREFGVFAARGAPRTPVPWRPVVSTARTRARRLRRVRWIRAGSSPRWSPPPSRSSAGEALLASPPVRASKTESFPRVPRPPPRARARGTPRRRRGYARAGMLRPWRRRRRPSRRRGRRTRRRAPNASPRTLERKPQPEPRRWRRRRRSVATRTRQPLAPSPTRFSPPRARFRVVRVFRALPTPRLGTSRISSGVPVARRRRRRLAHHPRAWSRSTSRRRSASPARALALGVAFHPRVDPAGPVLDVELRVFPRERVQPERRDFSCAAMISACLESVRSSRSAASARRVSASHASRAARSRSDDSLVRAAASAAATLAASASLRIASTSRSSFAFCSSCLHRSSSSCASCTSLSASRDSRSATRRASDATAAASESGAGCEAAAGGGRFFADGWRLRDPFSARARRRLVFPARCFRPSHRREEFVDAPE